MDEEGEDAGRQGGRSEPTAQATSSSPWLQRVAPGLRERCTGLFVYYSLTSAMLAMPMSAMTVLLNSTLGLSARPEAVTAYYNTTFATTLLRPLFGLAADKASGGRRVLLVPACCVAGVATLALGAVTSVPQLFLAGVVAAAGYCAAESAADGELIEAAAGDADSVAKLLSAAMFVRTAASATAAVLGAGLVSMISPRSVITIAGCCGLAAAAVLQSRRRMDAAPHDHEEIEQSTTPRQILAALRRTAAPACLLFLLAAAPEPADAYTSFTSIILTPRGLGLANAVSTLSELLGTLLYGAAARRHTTPCLLAVGVCAAAAVSALRAAAYFVPVPAYIISVAALSGFTSRFAFMPVLVLSGQLAPPGAEAASFAALITLNNGGALVGGAITIALTAALRIGQPPERSWRPLPPFVVACALARCLPLLLLPFLTLKHSDGDTAPLTEGSDEALFLDEAAVPLLDSR
jgi:MFS family permease